MLRHKEPVYIRLTRQTMPDLHPAGYVFKVGVADTIFEPSEKKGKLQATVFASGGPIGEAVAAAKSLAEKGFSVRVVNAGTLLPFDKDAVGRAAKDSQRIVTVEDHNIVGGLGSAVCESLAELGLACPVIRMGVSTFGESATGPELYKKYGLSAEHVADACLRNLD
jgi:transketolase